MKITYKILEDNTILLGETPKIDMVDGLKIIYGEEVPFDTGMTHAPAITHDVKAGENVYPLPPAGAIEGFSEQTIKEVILEDRCLDIISK